MRLNDFVSPEERKSYLVCKLNTAYYDKEMRILFLRMRQWEVARLHKLTVVRWWRSLISRFRNLDLINMW